MRILVTGASGLLGLNLALEAARAHQNPWIRADQNTAQEPHQVFGLVNRQSLQTTAFTVLEGDLLAAGTLERVLEQVKPDWIIHCAALANVDECEEDPERAQQLNSILPGRLAEYVARGGARLVHISTDAVFDGQRGNYVEEDLPNPLSVYARTKLAGEQAVAAANPDAIIARVNLFGWSLNGRRSLAEWFFNNLTVGKPVMGFTDVYFCPVLVNQLAHILLRMLALNLHGLYHVVSRAGLSKYAFGMALAERFGLDTALITPASVAQAGLKAARSPNLTLRNDRLQRALAQAGEEEVVLPTVSTGLEQFYTLYQQGYPQYLHAMRTRS